MFLNFFTFSSNATRVLSGFVLGAAVLLMPGIWLAMVYPSFSSGDLTRIAQLPGADFRPTMMQTSLDRPAIASPDQADVLVLGDSFSVENLWQSTFEAKTGLKTATWRIREEGCVADWLNLAMAGELSKKAKIVIIETVERVFMQRMVSPQELCKDQAFEPELIGTTPVSGQAERSPLFPIDVKYVIRTALNARKSEYLSGRFMLRKAVMVDLDRSDLFSSRLSDRLLYLRQDELPTDLWNAADVSAALAKFQKLQRQAKAKGMTLLLVTVPDKSTVYSPWVKAGQWSAQPDESLFSSLEKSIGTTSNLLPDFRVAATQIKDFYRPDDTHLSLEGFRFLGERISRLVTTPKD